MARYLGIIIAFIILIGMILYGCHSTADIPDTTTSLGTTTTSPPASSSTSSSSTLTPASSTTSTTGLTYWISAMVYRYSTLSTPLRGPFPVNLYDYYSHALVDSKIDDGWIVVFTGVPNGTYLIAASLEGWQIDPVSVEVKSGDASVNLIASPENWQVVQHVQLAGYKLFYDIAKIGTSGIFAVAADDNSSIILKSTDTGYNWSVAFTNQPTSERIVGIADVGGEAMIATRSGKIYTSSGGVASWNYSGSIPVITNEARQWIKNFSAVNANTWVIIHSYSDNDYQLDPQNNILLTQNGGSNFTDISPYSAVLYRNMFDKVFALSATDIVAAGTSYPFEYGSLSEHAVADRYNGSSWQTVGDLGDIPNLSLITLRIRGTRGYAATGGDLYVSSDLASWSRDFGGFNADVFATYLPESGFSGSLAVGSSGLILRRK